MKEVLLSILNFLGLAWWIEIVTRKPQCTYYFGPFLTVKEADLAKTGYIEDLETEGAMGFIVFIKRCKPNELTVEQDLGERIDRKASPAFSGQC
ncbi:hypothetical protein NIES2119_11425 [[Phormidium ambiguum] IAM M-71]|uniref:DUF1816 domain-containing protein n=1 Tax=[Phormidium ambiguum] IAM M-71 TaxID=454136 RepID=A0A1U7ILN0_9CYAN|nr:DUF1816 domain-containing protein [Phormidium ambiguum]OKH38157.1 hypothetical protein NIES2119_11425 [Phormidium ambiguum IAM M-71]